MVKAYGWAIAKRSGSGDRFNEEFGPGVSLSSSASVMTTSSASVPHVTRSSSTPVASTTTSPSTVTCFSPVNPLVAAGLVPEDLSDILITPPVDAAVTKERTKRIVGARHLTADEYVQMVKDIENKKREAEELKEKKKAERDMKKAERERTQKEKLEQQAARKKEREEKKKQHEREKKKEQLRFPGLVAYFVWKVMTVMALMLNW